MQDTPFLDFWNMGYTINQYVKARMPFLDATDDMNIDIFTMEVYYTLAVYFGYTVPDDVTTIEDPATYNELQKSLIADIVACYLIIRRVISNKEGDAAAGSGSSTPTGNRFLKKAKAGSTEAEWDIAKSTEYEASFGLSTGDLLDMLKNQACLKARQFYIDLKVCDDGTCSCNPLDDDGGITPGFVICNP